MAVIFSEGNNLKFYQRISFWVTFFIVLNLINFLIIDLIVLDNLFKNFFYYFFWFIIIKPIGIFVALDTYSNGYMANNVSYIWAAIFWIITWISIIIFRKKSFFQIITIFIFSWFLLSTLGLGYSFWIDEIRDKKFHSGA